jgi:hypothetical protein
MLPLLLIFRATSKVLQENVAAAAAAAAWVTACCRLAAPDAAGSFSATQAHSVCMALFALLHMLCILLLLLLLLLVYVRRYPPMGVLMALFTLLQKSSSPASEGSCILQWGSSGSSMRRSDFCHRGVTIMSTTCLHVCCCCCNSKQRQAVDCSCRMTHALHNCCCCCC